MMIHSSDVSPTVAAVTLVAALPVPISNSSRRVPIRKGEGALEMRASISGAASER